MEALPDELLFDDESKAIAESDLGAVITAFENGGEGLPEIEYIQIACELLMVMAGQVNHKIGNQILDELHNRKGVTYSRVALHIPAFLKDMDSHIEAARDKRSKQIEYQNNPPDIPF
ncbi:MAG: hypothetical protein Q7T66_04915 [Herminiimonas sp.]|uniref:hypothetical protein n=1 Tax=Herminiimonas sp. TaxID=1926289 RepID=UPI0027200D05|nr:hypothetical protein [Herminiimonas sp.]MDO9419987.1 hypothetical protein [Herminiimonas sp.]